ncbi:patatin family protein [Lactobacillus sp. PV037]|uniref:patatin-like phospholipase family protein n=1 Tax=unclassified Lactobacillus TaxID=2620435 RepID=UPI00223F9F64|nr:MULTISPECIES: patatin family protein [unclassified Lactobacillus]QNQ82252.1 patatin family protein [Lactobacillus sp. PV012]QNQ83637.1 patatin family protein [Lactobacillus sp. PV037]
MKQKTSLVLEGGAIRDIFTTSVLDVFLKNNIKFDQAVGVSAGAAFGVNYKSHQPQRALRYNKRFAKDDNYASFKSWRKTGNLYNVEMCYHIIPDLLDYFDYDTFASDPMDFWVCATNIETGKPTFHRLISGRGEDMEWIKASASIPVFAKPVEINGNHYWDGGVSDSIPIDFFPRFGPTKQVVITTQPRSYRKTPGKHQRLYSRIFKDYPAVKKQVLNRAVNYNATLDKMKKLEKGGEMLIIAPPEPLKVKTFKNSPQAIQNVYEIGVKTAYDNMQKIKSFLKGN